MIQDNIITYSVLFGWTKEMGVTIPLWKDGINGI